MSIIVSQDAPSVERLYHEHRRPIQAYLARMVGDREAAENLCQETFLKALRGWERHGPIASPVAWLYRIAANTAYDHLRRWRARGSLASPDDLDAACCDFTPEGALAEGEAVRSALAQLPRRYREPLLMHACAGLSLREIADALGCSSDAAKMRLFRARRRFREVYRA